MKRLFGLIGYPVSHSFSAIYFNDKFEKEGIIDSHYELFPLPDIEDLPNLLLKHPSLAGLNVTIPHKTSVIQYLDEISPDARALGAVNTFKIGHKHEKMTLSGFNTDILGFELSIKPLLKNHHRAAMILGTGGAAKAAALVFARLGIEYVFVSRTPQGINEILYPELCEELFERFTVVVNATPLGMSPAINTFPPIPYECLCSHHLLFDMVYNPLETLFLQKGKQQGASVKNGLEMLYLQADHTWKIWQDS
ncbi:MAG: shikimate dehydrogenase [Bacteroidales bacterium]|nr:shikimate dehydrogenase [Bacteroidales bacterium]MDZ4205516.1 shikimate dehydrogenase [Bacteroidales bacterium]